MYGAVFQLDSYEHLLPGDQCALMVALVEALAGVNCAFLEANRVPRLYVSGVVYAMPETLAKKFPRDSQPWRDIPRILATTKTATCHELCAWRVAELRTFEGVHAEPYVTAEWSGGRLMFHVQVKLPGGQIEDPSANLGMGDPWAR